MKRAVVVPVDLGGSPTACLLRPRRRPPPTPELVKALIEHYRLERAPPGAALEVAFFHGGLPDDALLEAAGGLPVRVACSPGDLTRAGAARLIQGGVQTIELEVATFKTRVLRELRRGYGGPMVRTQLDALQGEGVRLGVTLIPGLPGTSHACAMADVEQLLGDDGRPLVSFARLYPALALSGTGLAQLASSGRWSPMHLGEAVTTVAEMMDRLELTGIAVARVGLQPGQDIPGTVCAGPVHPNLRQLVEVRRFHQRMAAALDRVPEGSAVELAVNPRDLAWARGTANENVRSLRARLSLRRLDVLADEAVTRGDVRLTRVAG